MRIGFIFLVELIRSHAAINSTTDLVVSIYHYTSDDSFLFVYFRYKQQFYHNAPKEV